MPPKYKNRGLDEAYLKYRSKDNYEILKPSKTTAPKPQTPMIVIAKRIKGFSNLIYKAI